MDTNTVDFGGGDHLSQRAGFTLIEVTLAIFVVSVGLLSIMALFPAGLSQSKKSSDETQVSMFADEVLNGYRAKIEADPAVWYLMGTPPLSGNPGLEAAASGMWEDWGRGITVKVSVATSPSTVRYIDWNGYLQYAFRYLLEFEEVELNAIKRARLTVWNGEFGSVDPDDAMVFVTEYYNYAMPPNE